MTYDFFKEYYDINEYKIKSINVIDNKLKIDVIMPIHLDLIANGYRPELDMTQEKTFIFNVQGPNKEYPLDISVGFNDKDISLGEDKLYINDFKVDIE